jgi:hypothetical protein
MMQIPAPSVGRLTDASTTPDFSIDPTVLRCRSDIGQSRRLSLPFQTDLGRIRWRTLAGSRRKVIHPEAVCLVPTTSPTKQTGHVRLES